MKKLINEFKTLNYSNSNNSINIKEKDLLILLIDNSGSTGSHFKKGTVFLSNSSVSVLQKEIEIAKDIATKHKNKKIQCFTFSSNAVNRGEVKFTSSGTLMFPIGITSDGGTNTLDGLKKVNEFITEKKMDAEVVLITDGQTSSLENELYDEYEDLKRKGVNLKIIAVSDVDRDFQQLKDHEESRIPGLDVVNWINAPSCIYTPNQYENDPFVMSTTDSSSTWNFLGESFSKKIIFPILVKDIFQFISQQPSTIKEEIEKDQDIQVFLVELGMYLGIFYIDYPESYVKILLNSSFHSEKTEEFNEFVNYGFSLKRQNKPFVRINLGQKLTDYRDRRNVFIDAQKQLKIFGTSLNKECISFNNGVICYRDSSNQLIKNVIYSVDDYKNIYFSFDSADDQSIRQGLRTLFGEFYDIPNAMMSSSTIFCVANEILKFLLVDHTLTLDNFYIQKLRKLAVIQVSMLRMEEKGKYGSSFFDYWKNGQLPSQHYSTPTTHLDLFTDFNINPFDMPQTLWWATMMMIISPETFKAQENVYKPFFEESGINNESTLLQYLRTKYSSKIEGTVKTCKFSSKNSVITLDPFLPNEKVLVLDNHTNDYGEICATQTHYSEHEKELLHNKCVWCSSIVPDDKWKPLTKPTSNDLINDNYPKLLVEKREGGFIDPHANQKGNNKGNKGNNQKQVIKGTSNCHLVLLEGTVGSGKTTFAQALEKELLTRNYTVINESTDKYCKTGIQMNQAVNNVSNAIKTKSKPNDCVIIIDTCGANITGNKIFFCTFEGYKIHYYRPNFNPSNINGYLSWSLNNVLSRKHHSNTTDYWLNPESATEKVCRQVHKDKAIKILGSSFTNNYDSNNNQIVEDYKKSLKTPEENVIEFITNNF